VHDLRAFLDLPSTAAWSVSWFVLLEEDRILPTGHLLPSLQVLGPMVEGSTAWWPAPAHGVRGGGVESDDDDAPVDDPNSASDGSGIDHEVRSESSVVACFVSFSHSALLSVFDSFYALVTCVFVCVLYGRVCGGWWLHTVACQDFCFGFVRFFMFCVVVLSLYVSHL